jgi:hypothetical protein
MIGGDMSSFRIRPHFRYVIDLDTDAARDRIVSGIGEAVDRCEVRSFPGYVNLRVPEAEQHFWSPQLNLSLEAADTGGTVIQGTYGPNTNLWAIFLYGYLTVGFLGIVATVLGLCQCMIGNPPWGFWLLGGALVVAAFLYFLAQTGQKLGAWQTFQLHQIFESAVGESVPIR